MKNYPEDWSKISERIKKKNHYRCERCKHKHDPEAGYTLTIHHLDGDTANNEEWNLASLCQRCHLQVQAKVRMNQLFWQIILPVSEWFKPHLEVYLRSKNEATT